MKCLVITPIGPGHAELAEACRQSVRRAVATSRGPFSDILHYLIDDTQGRAGRSAARNHGLDKAREIGADWVFLLDADDVMVETAFAAVEPHVGTLDAVWGRICELASDSDAPRDRPGQIAALRSLDELLRHPPYLTLQMGHFVRTSLASSIGFDPDMDCGEDFRFYCEEWSRGRCAKIDAVFFVNRRGMHSSGPRSADGAQWARAVETVFTEYRARRSVGGGPLPIGRNNVIVTAHPDDETLWCGGLVLRFSAVRWTVICCSIPRHDAVRAHYFFDACARLGATARLLPFVETEPGEALRSLDVLDLSAFDCIVTHNAHGEYGHNHHAQIHRHIVEHWSEKPIVTFGYRPGGEGAHRIELRPDELKAKLEALSAYRHLHPYLGRSIPKWEALVHRYYTVEGLRPDVETYDRLDSTSEPATVRGDYQIFDLDAEGRPVDIGSRLQLKLQAIPLPDLAGKHVLDIGCDFGFWSFLAAQKGAVRVLGLERNRPVKGAGPVDLVAMNRRTAARHPLLSVCGFERVDVGRQWPEVGPFDVAFLFSLYHHVYENCGGDHRPIWYWLWRSLRPDGILLWENPLSAQDTVVRVNVSPAFHPDYTPERLLAAAERFFVARHVGPALHEPTREVYAFTPRKRTPMRLPVRTLVGAGGASRAFVHDGNRRIGEIETAIGIRAFPGSLNLTCHPSAFDWEQGYVRARISDVVDRSQGLGSAWKPRWARFYPVTIENVPAFAFRFEGESYPDDFIELIAGTRLRDVVGEDAVLVREVPEF